MDNFQLRTYLITAPLGEEAKHNLTTIFRTLTDARKMEILNHWPKYLDLLLQIEQKGKEERQQNIQEALGKIENIISDALERDRQKAERETEKIQENHENFIGAETYDAQHRAQEFQKKLKALQRSDTPLPLVPKPPAIPSNPLYDPL